MKFYIFNIILLLFTHSVLGQFTSREYFRVGKNNFDNSKYFEAIDFFDRAISEDPDYESALFLRGKAFLELKKYQLAIQDFNKIIEQRQSGDSYSAEYFLCRGIAYRELKNFRYAEEDFNKALSLNPAYSEAFYEMGILKYQTLKDKKEAILEIDRAIQHDPENPEYYFKRAEIKAYMAKFDFSPEDLFESAIRDISFAIALDPDNFDYYYQRSKINRNRGKPADALVDYDKMIKIDPERVESWAERGIIKMHSEKYESAIGDFTQAIRLDPNNEQYYRFRALCRHNLVDFNGAYYDYSSAIDLLTEELKSKRVIDRASIQRILADTYIKRGAAIIQEGNSLNACSDFRMAYELGSKMGLNYLRKYCGI